MTRILITKKHKGAIAGAVIGILLFLFLMFMYVISPQMEESQKVAEELKGIEDQKAELQAELAKVKEAPVLLESEIVVNKPEIPNGIQLDAFFKNLKALATKHQVDLYQYSVEEAKVFPSENGEVAAATEEEGDAAGTAGPVSNERQVLKTVGALDVASSDVANIQNFIDQLENGDRFIKVINVSLNREMSDTGDSFTESGSGSIVFEMYYLSNYDTAQPLF